MHLHRRILILAAAALVSLPCAAAGARVATTQTAGAAQRSSSDPNVVIVWNQALITALETAGTPAPVGTGLGAIVKASVCDAVNGIARRFTPIHVAPAAPRGASRAAAAAAAAHEALVALFPSQQATLDAQLASSLAEIGGGGSESVARGVAWGKSVADQIVAWRAGDHFSDPLPLYVSGTQPGDCQPTPPGFGTPPLV